MLVRRLALTSLSSSKREMHATVARRDDVAGTAIDRRITTVKKLSNSNADF
jgi:hypothetical protein